MKQHSEKRTEAAVKMLVETLTRNFYDTGVVLDEFEAPMTIGSASNPSSTMPSSPDTSL